MPEDCLFCRWQDGADREILGTSEHFYSVADGWPVSPGHSLIISRRHFQHVHEMRADEAADFHRFRQSVMAELQARLQPDGFNTGENNGEAAGQSVFHYHHHVIPRYRGDVPNPRGGIRNILRHPGHH